MTNHEKREKRKKQTAEVFTPEFLVNEMLDKLPKEVWEEDKTFCDPACGNGNFLIAILLRKLKKGYNPLKTLQTLYGADIMRDNIRECRERLLKIVKEFEPITEEHIKAVFKNIMFLNRVSYPNGSLDYDFSFLNNPKKADIDEWMEKIKNGEIDLSTLPVSDSLSQAEGEIFDPNTLYSNPNEEKEKRE
jgi:hypothetical protein